MAELAAITGVSRGIGRATALALARRGLALALIGRESEDHERTRRECEAEGVRVTSHSCDMAQADQVQRAAEQLLDQQGPPSVVVNNAATLFRGPKVHETEVSDWDRVMAVNLRGPFLLCRALLPSMLGAGRGRFVQVSSVSGTIGCPQMAAYGASKWGLIGLNQSLAEELEGTGLISVAILPGSVDTAMLKQTPFEPDMTSEDVARVIVYYALDAPTAVNGASVQVYG